MVVVGRVKLRQLWCCEDPPWPWPPAGCFKKTDSINPLLPLQTSTPFESVSNAADVVESHAEICDRFAFLNNERRLLAEHALQAVENTRARANS